MNKGSSVLEWVEIMNRDMFEMKNIYYGHIKTLKTEELPHEMLLQIKADKMQIMKLEKRWERLLHQKTTSLSIEVVEPLGWKLYRLYNKLTSISMIQNYGGILYFDNKKIFPLI